ncbi:MAG: response regulator [Acidobacteriia bacterium]|nr:response regulator [Terriglobia bacterium]
MKTLLVVEDDASVLTLMGHWLKQYRLLQATTAEQALQLSSECGSQIALLITDVRLATRSGIQVALRLRAEIPDLPVILMSGYPESAWRALDAADLRRLGTHSVTILDKPLQAQVLASRVAELIGESTSEVARAT